MTEAKPALPQRSRRRRHGDGLYMRTCATAKIRHSRYGFDVERVTKNLQGNRCERARPYRHVGAAPPVIQPYSRSLMQAVCADHRVEQPVPITKNAAQARHVGVGRGPQRADCARWGGVKGPNHVEISRNAALGRRRCSGRQEAEHAFFRAAEPGGRSKWPASSRKVYE
jgi:hypothetical protein